MTKESVHFFALLVNWRGPYKNNYFLYCDEKGWLAVQQINIFILKCCLVILHDAENSGHIIS